MYLLGKNFKAFAITPDGDLINLIQKNSSLIFNKSITITNRKITFVLKLKIYINKRLHDTD